MSVFDELEGSEGVVLSVAKLAQAYEVRCDRDVSASALSTFKGGGSVARVYIPQGITQFVYFMRGVKSITRNVFLLGGGSNVIIDDGVVARPVVSTRGLDGMRLAGDGSVIAQSGVRLSVLIAQARRAGLGGLEFLAGVPCTLGGALHMNAGAFGQEIGDFVSHVCVLGVHGNVERLERDDIAFGYRRGVNGTVIAAGLRLRRMSAEESRARAREYIKERRRTQPTAPSCGSVFKRAQLPAGRYIDLVGLKGTRVGGASISHLHANFIVNDGGASAADFFALERLARDKVFDCFGVSLEREFVVLTDEQQ